MNATRAALIHAMIAMILENGFEGLSVRDLAARAGVSAGAVQHHFPSKSAMLEAAMDAITTSAGERYAELESIADPGERLHAVVDLLVPGDASDPAARVWLAFAARAAVDESTRESYAQLWSRLRAGIRMLVAAASGELASAEDSSIELLALLDGLALSVVAEQNDDFRAVARDLAHRRVDALIAGGP